MADIETVAGELTFSDVPGFRLGDFDTECPFVPGRQCAEKIKLVSMYTSHIAMDGEGELPDSANIDLFKVDIKLREYRLHAAGEACAEAAANACPTRQAMNKNTVRQAGVWSVRKVMSKGSLSIMVDVLQPADMPDEEAALFARLHADMAGFVLDFAPDKELLDLGEVLAIDALKRRPRVANAAEIVDTLDEHTDVDDAFRVIARSRIMDARGIATQRPKPPQEEL